MPGKPNCFGKAAHSGQAFLGENAINRMGRVIAGLEDYDKDLMTRMDIPFFRYPTVNIGTISGGTGVTQVPDSCQIEFDRQVFPGENINSVNDEVLSVIEQIRNEHGIQFVLGWNYEFSIIIGAIIIVAYTILGGILAVAWTDFFQIVIVLLGLIIMFPLAVKSAGGWGAVKAATPPEFFDVFMSKGATVGDHLWWWGALLGVGLGTMAGPDLYQRAIIAKTGKIASTASVTSGIGYWLLGCIPVFLGFVGITLVSQGVLSADVVDEDSEQIILMLARLVLHPTVAGIFIASLLAAVMSTADSAIFATAAVMGNDIVKPIYEKTKGKELSDKGLISVTRYSIVGFTLLAFLIGISWPTMYDLLIIGFQLLFHMLWFPLILGVYWKSANTTGAVWGMGVGFVIAMVWLISSGNFYPEPEWLWTFLPGIVSGVVMVVVSLATQKKDPAKPLVATDGRIIKFAELASKD